MEWLRCNKCYESLLKSNNKFIMTLCGHIFCGSCLSRANSRCYECRTVISRSLTLTKPPKLETMINYFSSTTRILQQTTKAMQFHDEQLNICFRGLKILGKKYEHGKRCYEESRRAVKYEQTRCQTKVELLKKMLADVQAFKKQYNHQRVYMTPSVNIRHPIFETPPISVSSSRSGCSRRSNWNVDNTPLQSNVERQRDFDGSRSLGAKWKPSLEPSGYSNCRNEPRPGCSNASGRSISTMDPGHTSFKTPTIVSQNEFVVPSIKKVPKSAVSRRKDSTKEFPRLSERRL